MRVVHEPAGREGADEDEGVADADRRVLATNAERADTFGSQLLGLRFRRDLPEEYALVFDLGSARWGLTDMLFVPVPLDVVWLREGEVVRVETLAPWRSVALVKSDALVEFPAGTADDVEPGDRLHFETDDDA